MFMWITLAHGYITSVDTKHQNTFRWEMPFQSPPFWCLMTTHGFAQLIYQMEVLQQEFPKYRRAPPRSVHNLLLHLSTSAHQLGSILPLYFANPP